MPLIRKLTVPQQKQDLILSEIPTIRKVSLNLAMVDASKISLIDAIDIANVSGVSADKFNRTLAGPDKLAQAKLMYAFAWVIARRIEPGITWDEMLTYDLEVIGTPMSAEEVEAEAKKARAVMGVVRLAGVTPDVARNLSMAEVQAVMPPKRRRARA
jgi:hypothetical protein